MAAQRGSESSKNSQMQSGGCSQGADEVADRRRAGTIALVVLSQCSRNFEELKHQEQEFVLGRWYRRQSRDLCRGQKLFSQNLLLCAQKYF